MCVLLFLDIFVNSHHSLSTRLFGIEFSCFSCFLFFSKEGFSLPSFILSDKVWTQLERRMGRPPPLLHAVLTTGEADRRFCELASSPSLQGLAE